MLLNSAEQKSLFEARNSPTINESTLGKLAEFALLNPCSMADVFCGNDKQRL